MVWFVCPPLATDTCMDDSPAMTIVSGSHLERELVWFGVSVAEHIFSSVLEQLQDAGWVTSHHLLGVGEWRYQWD